MLTHSLHFFAPMLTHSPDMEDPCVDSHCGFFTQIFWHLLGLYDLMLEERETVENIHTCCIYHLPSSLPYH